MAVLANADEGHCHRPDHADKGVLPMGQGCGGGKIGTKAAIIQRLACCGKHLAHHGFGGCGIVQRHQPLVTGAQRDAAPIQALCGQNLRQNAERGAPPRHHEADPALLAMRLCRP